MDKQKQNGNITRGLYDQCYKGSELVNITSHFKEYKDLIDKTNFSRRFEDENHLNKFICDAIGPDVDDEKLELLTEYCSVENLKVDGELDKLTKNTFEWSKDPTDPLIIESVDLQTVNHTKQRNLLKNHQVHSKYRSEKPIIYEPLSIEPNDQLLTPESDILIYVRVYVPFTSRSKQSSGALGKLSVNYVIAIAGCQTLDKLRDKISCEADYSVSTEMSKAPIRQKTENAKDVYKSGFFFIEGIFYNDLRDPNNKDNSKVIRDWAEARNLGNYKSAKMEETRVDSLNLRFGFPWVYQHQGECEHLISFSNARFVNPADELNIECYPRIVRIKPRPNRYCMTCGLYSVNWVTTSNSRLPHNPCLFCDSCFKSYNYIRGKKIGNFKAYPYPYNSELLGPHLAATVRSKPKLSCISQRKSQDENDESEAVAKDEVTEMDTSEIC